MTDFLAIAGDLEGASTAVEEFASTTAPTCRDFFGYLFDRATVEPTAADRQSSSLRALMKTSPGTSTRPIDFIFFLPSFCFSSSLRLRVMSPP